MGLTIHYDLKPPPRVRKSERILALVENLRQCAMDLPFESCDDKLVHLLGKNCEFDRDRRADTNDPTRWLRVQATEYLEVRKGDSTRFYAVAPSEIIAFGCWPGVGCESMNIGLCRYPETISIGGKTHPTRLGGWRWSSFCKTQYASNIGVRHFLHCHNLVCVLLDVAEELGFRVTVKDEGKFHQNRDLDALAKEIGEWNVMLAGFAGQLRDAFGTESIASPITEHPAYEHLEAQNNVDVSRLITLLSNASRVEIEAHRQAHPEQWKP